MPDHPIEQILIRGAEVAKAHNEFYTAFGMTMTAWARLEGCLFYWFMACVELHEELARAIFFSSKNFAGRRDMLNAAIPFSPFEEPTKLFLRAASKKARQYAEFRNRVAHGEPVLNMREGSPSYKQYVLTEGRSLDAETEKNDITLEHLARATRNVNDLRRLLWDLHPFYRPGYPDASPEAYRELVLRLPNEAHSKEPAPMQPQKKQPPPETEA